MLEQQIQELEQVAVKRKAATAEWTKREAAITEWKRKNLEKLVNKYQRAPKKQLKLKAKVVRSRDELLKSKRRHNEMWSLKNVIALVDKFHAAIRENAPIVGYRTPYCSLILHVCQENQKLDIQRQRAKKQGEDTSSLHVLQELSTQ